MGAENAAHAQHPLSEIGGTGDVLQDPDAEIGKKTESQGHGQLDELDGIVLAAQKQNLQ